MAWLSLWLWSPDALFERARRDRQAGRYEQALEAVDAYLTKLGRRRRTAPGVRSHLDRLEAGHLLRGVVLLALGRRDAAIPDLIAGGQLLSTEPAAWAFLVTELLDRRSFEPSTIALVVGYLRRCASVDDLANVLDRLERLLRPGAWAALDLTGVRQWNEAISKVLPQLSWPHFYLGLIRANSGDFAGAALELAHARGYRIADAVLAYVMSRADREEAGEILRRTAPTADDRASHLLLAHAWRAVGDAGAAAAFFRAADALDALDDDGLLAYAETLINAGKGDAAREPLARVGAQDSARWKLLAACVVRGPLALRLLSEIATDVEFAGPAAKRLMAIAIAEPATSGAATALDAIPDEWRRSLFRIARSRVCHAGGDLPGALRALCGMLPADTPVGRCAAELADRYLREMYAAGNYGEILAAAYRGLPIPTGNGAAAAMVAAAAHQFFCSSAHLDSEQAREAVTVLVGLKQQVPEITDHAGIGLLRGLLLAAARDFDTALGAFDAIGATSAGVSEYWIQRSRCALLAGRIEVAAAGMPHLVLDGPRAMRVAAAIYAVQEDWDNAFRMLDAAGAESADLPYLAALAFHSGRLALLSRLTEADPGCGYYAAMGAAHAGDLTEAARLCAAVPPAHLLRSAADRLEAWLTLQQARTSLHIGDTTAFCSGLAHALEQIGDGGEGVVQAEVLAQLEDVHASLATAYVAADSRNEIAAAFRRLAGTDGIVTSEHCHRLALCHLATAESRALDHIWDDAFTELETASAYVCAALADLEYMRGWTRRRLAAYGARGDPAQQALQSGIFAMFQASLTRWEDMLRLDGAKFSQRAAELAVLLRVELRGATLLRTVGGFACRPGGKSIAGGPYFVSGVIRGCRELAMRLNALEEEHAAAWDGSTLLDQIRTAEAAAAGSLQQALRTVRSLFSALGPACLLEEEGCLEEALEQLRARPWHASPACRLAGCTSEEDRICGEGADRFAQCNPGFAFRGGGVLLREEIVRVELRLLHCLAEARVSATPERIDEGIRYWAQALAAYPSRREETAARIRATALGRARTLANADRGGEAIRLLAAVREQCDHPDLAGELAPLHAAAAIRTINQTSDVAAGVEGLRAARRLNMNSTWINRNLVLALRMRADEIIDDDNAGAEALLTEALSIGEPNLLADPHNSDLESAVFSTRRALLLARCRGGRASGDELFDAWMYAEGKNEAELSAVYHNRGVEKVKQGQLADGIADLEKALMLEPTSDVTRSMLEQALDVRQRSVGGGRRRAG